MPELGKRDASERRSPLRPYAYQLAAVVNKCHRTTFRGVASASPSGWFAQAILIHPGASREISLYPTGVS